MLALYGWKRVDPQNRIVRCVMKICRQIMYYLDKPYGYGKSQERCYEKQIRSCAHHDVTYADALQPSPAMGAYYGF